MVRLALPSNADPVSGGSVLLRNRLLLPCHPRVLSLAKAWRRRGGASTPLPGLRGNAGWLCRRAEGVVEITQLSFWSRDKPMAQVLPAVPEVRVDAEEALLRASR